MRVLESARECESMCGRVREGAREQGRHEGGMGSVTPPTGKISVGKSCLLLVNHRLF